MRTPESELEALRQQDLYRSLRHRVGQQGRSIRMGDKDLINFSSNDYLGLAGSSALIKAASEGARIYGAGNGASRLISGGSELQIELEEAIAAFTDREAALTFANGYTASLGVLGALAGKGDTIILDKRCHASLIDGARLSGATLRVFPHNELSKLERLLTNCCQRDQSTDSRVIIVTESIFSMDGDTPPLSNIIELKSRFGALLLLDEAHAFGLTGPGGRGLAHNLKLQHGVDFLTATLGKAAGSAGGFVAASEAWIDLIRNRARSLIYSTAPPPAQTAAAIAGLQILQSEEGDLRRSQLKDRTLHFAELMKTTPGTGAIVPIILHDEAITVSTSAALEKMGFLVPAIRYPTVASGQARLRVTLSAAHLREDVSALASALGSLLSDHEATLG